MVARLIAINVVVYFIQNIIPASNALLALTPRDVVQEFKVWQLVSYMFLHGGFTHLLFNMLMLWIFGASIESFWGPRQFLRYYLFCGVGGGLLSLVFSYDSHIVGASGAIFGLYLAYAMMFPDNLIYLYFLFPVKAKYLVTGMAVLQLAYGIGGPSGVAYFAHLGGMAAGLFFFRQELIRRFRLKRGQSKWKAQKEQPRPRPVDEDKDNIDSILDKISSKGYDKLTSIERRILEQYSRRDEGKTPDD